MTGTSVPHKQLSIITVVRNGADVIGKTIESVATEKTGEIEYLVIDGASSDGTAAGARRFAGVVDTLVCEPDAGIYDAMNKGASLAAGTWLLFLNAGDTLRPGMPRQMLELVAHSTPAPDLVCGKVAMVDAAGRSLHYTHPVRRGDTASLLLDNCVAHQATLMRRSLFQRHGGFSLDYKIMGDYEYWVRLLKGGACFLFTDLVVAEFSTSGVSSQRASYLRAQKERLQILVEHGYLSAQKAACVQLRQRAMFMGKTAVRALLGPALSRRIALARSRRT